LKEIFHTYYNKNVPFRNRTEKYITEYTQELCKKPLAFTIEELKTHLENELLNYTNKNPKHGKVSLSKINISGCIMGHNNIQTRQFSIYGPRRGTYTLVISEELFKDANNNYAIDYYCVFNRSELKRIKDLDKINI